MSSTVGRHEIQNYFWHNLSGLKIIGQQNPKNAQIARFLEMQLLDMLASQIVAGLSILCVCVCGGAYEVLNYRITFEFFENYRNTVINFFYR